MVITPQELQDLNNPDYAKELLKLEKTIDSHLEEQYKKANDTMQPLKLAELSSFVKTQLISKYNEAGWTLNFQKSDQLGWENLYITEAIQVLQD